MPESKNKKQRARNRDGKWRRKRSDAGQPGYPGKARQGTRTSKHRVVL